MSAPPTMSLSHLKFRHLMLVLHLQEHRNLHKAARHLNISQPAASAMLRDLESLLGLRLFSRSRQGVVPTKEAGILADRARAMINEFDALAKTVEQLGRNTPPLLRLGLVPQAFVTYLPGAIKHFRLSGGSAALRTQEGTAAQLVNLLFDGMLDCVVGRLSSASIAEGHDLGELAFTPLYDEQICVVEGTAGPRKRSPGYADLARRDWVLQRRDSSVRRELADAFLRRGHMLPEPIVETTNYIQSLAILGQSDYCTVAPRRAVEIYVKLGMVRILNVPLDIAPMPVSFITRKSAETHANLALLRESFARAVPPADRPQRQVRGMDGAAQPTHP